MLFLLINLVFLAFAHFSLENESLIYEEAPMCLCRKTERTRSEEEPLTACHGLFCKCRFHLNRRRAYATCSLMLICCCKWTRKSAAKLKRKRPYELIIKCKERSKAKTNAEHKCSHTRFVRIAKILNRHAGECIWLAICLCKRERESKKRPNARAGTKSSEMFFFSTGFKCPLQFTRKHTHM